MCVCVQVDSVQVKLPALLQKLKASGQESFSAALGDMFLERDLVAVSAKEAAKLLREAGMLSIDALAIRDELVEEVCYLQSDMSQLQC